MFTVYLKEFITTGKFGPIALGTSIDEVIIILGEPDDKIEYDNGHCGITYAWYEFFYKRDTGVLYAIQNDHLAAFPNRKTKRVNNKKDICFKNDYFEINIWFLKKGKYLTFAEVIDNLKKEKIEFEIAKGYSNESIIKFKSGVTLDFDDLSGLASFGEDSNDWTFSEKITDNNETILNGVRLFNSDFT
jgi:hypothetical protein